jgi:hypothetical protein
MTRKPFRPTRLQAASLLIIAGGVFGILISDIIRLLEFVTDKPPTL